MRIGLYGLPTAGKSYLLSKIQNFSVFEGSSLLRNCGFDALSDEEKKERRKNLAKRLLNEDDFVMSGHYAFDQKIVFTKEDGELYDIFLYLYVEPNILKERMENSEKNKKYSHCDIRKWQNFEIDSLRDFCHKNNKDFYILDSESGENVSIEKAIEFLHSIKSGFSTIRFAKECVSEIEKHWKDKEILLTDGDKTLIKEDSSSLLGYKTHVFDNNFYTGYQSFLHHKELDLFLKDKDINVDYHKHEKTRECLKPPFVLLTAGSGIVWKNIIPDQLLFFGCEMCADSKFFITKFLREKGYFVTAYGDSLNDYFMLKEADIGYLIAKEDGSISRSLKNKSMEGLYIV